MATLILDRPVIGITGSAGKTTTKEMIASVLGTRWKVFKTPYNNNVIPSTRRHARIINSSHQAVVLEYGTAAPGLIRLHCQIIQPNIGVITNVGTAHIGNFGGKIERLAAAKSELIRHMKPTGLLVINNDDRGSELLNTSRFKGQLVTVAIDNEASYKARKVRYAHGGMQFETYFQKAWHEIFIPVPGRHNVYNALSTVAVADYLGFTPPEIISGLKKMHRTGRRVYVHTLGSGLTVIDDSYSANPHAVKAAVDVLMNVGGGKRVVVLGDMRELGVYTRQGHREVGAYVAASGVDYFLALGPRTRYAVQEAIKCGMPSAKIKHFSSRPALHIYLKTILNGQSTVLVKGSHGSEMYLTADYIRGKKRKKNQNPAGTAKTSNQKPKPSLQVPPKKRNSRPKPGTKVTTGRSSQQLNPEKRKRRTAS